MSIPSHVFWWRIEIGIPAELEETLLWKLDDLGINRVAVQFEPEHQLKRTLVAWLPSCDWPISERLKLLSNLEPVVRTFGLSISEPVWEKPGFNPFSGKIPAEDTLEEDA